MPNWCENHVTINGDTHTIQKLVDVKFDFAVIKPEPTWEANDDDSWYDWRLENWGCKWNRDEQSIHVLDYDSVSATFSFLTPWGPPLAIYEALQEMSVDVEALFFEPGVQAFGGYSKRRTWEIDFGACVSKHGSPEEFFSRDPLGKQFEELFGASQWFQSEEDEEDELSEM